MILAISSVIPYRKQTHQQHPFGYYLAAMQYFDPLFLSTGLSGIQDLLLICRFGIYHHIGEFRAPICFDMYLCSSQFGIGTSVWEIAQLCMRMCIENEMHKKSKASLDPLQDQLRRRIFWVCYITDRYSSTTLNRPFSLADRDIDVGLPVELDDEDIEAVAASFTDLDTLYSQQVPLRPNEMSVFLQAVKLRKITSRIQSETSQLLRATSSPTGKDEIFLATGRVYTVLHKMIGELEQWRSVAPIFDHPRCLFERQEWYDLLQAREALHLVRKAVDLVPKRNGIPPTYILKICLKCAIRASSLYSDLFRRSITTYTRSYFQMMFTSGLTILFCISVSSDLESTTVRECRTALACCEETLTTMSTYMPDSRHYVKFFEAVCLHVFPKLDPREPKATSNALSKSYSITGVSEDVQEQRNYVLSATEFAASALPPNADLGLPGQGPDSSHQGFRQENDGVSPPLFNQEIINNVFNEGGNISTDPLDWAFLGEEALWNIGLGNYVYGDSTEIPGLFEGTEFGHASM